MTLTPDEHFQWLRARPERLSGWASRDSKEVVQASLERAMWTPATRRQHSREGLRYESDVTDEEWRLVEPYLPAPRRTGRPRAWPMREIVNAIFYVLRGGVPWRLLPRPSAAGDGLSLVLRLRDDGVFEPLNHPSDARPRAERARGLPIGCIIDSQSVKTTEAGGPRGYDAGKKIKGRKRHALVDTDGRRPGAVSLTRPTSRTATAAGPLLAASRRAFPFIEKVFADSGYAGKRVADATAIAVEIVRSNPDQIGFAVQPRRWVVERFFAWIGRNRRLAKDFEATLASATSLPLRRLRHAAHPTHRPSIMSFGTDSKPNPKKVERFQQVVIRQVARLDGADDALDRNRLARLASHTR